VGRTLWQASPISKWDFQDLNGFVFRCLPEGQGEPLAKFPKVGEARALMNRGEQQPPAGTQKTEAFLQQFPEPGQWLIMVHAVGGGDEIETGMGKAGLKGVFWKEVAIGQCLRVEIKVDPRSFQSQTIQVRYQASVPASQVKHPGVTENPGKVPGRWKEGPVLASRRVQEFPCSPVSPFIEDGVAAPFYMDLDGLSPVAGADSVIGSCEWGAGSLGEKAHSKPYRPRVPEEEGVKNFEDFSTSGEEVEILTGLKTSTYKKYVNLFLYTVKVSTPPPIGCL
jgi:hypothetical protein